MPLPEFGVRPQQDAFRVIQAQHLARVSAPANLQRATLCSAAEPLLQPAAVSTSGSGGTACSHEATVGAGRPQRSAGAPQLAPQRSRSTGGAEERDSTQLPAWMLPGAASSGKRRGLGLRAAPKVSTVPVRVQLGVLLLFFWHGFCAVYCGPDSHYSASTLF